MNAEIELPTHPRTGLRAVGIVNGKPVWPILGGSGEGGGDDKGGGGDGDDKFTAPTSQEEFDRMVQDRVRRAERKGYTDAEGKYKPKADKHDALEAELASDKDKAVAAAKEEALEAAKAENAPRLVKLAFKAEAKGVLSTEQLAELAEDLDLTFSKYLDKDGNVDEEKVTKKVTAFAPKGDDKNDQRRKSLGQGHHPPANQKPGDAGRAAAEKRFGSRQRQDA